MEKHAIFTGSVLSVALIVTQSDAGWVTVRSVDPDMNKLRTSTELLVDRMSKEPMSGF